MFLEIQSLMKMITANVIAIAVITSLLVSCMVSFLANFVSAETQIGKSCYSVELSKNFYPQIII